MALVHLNLITPNAEFSGHPAHHPTARHVSQRILCVPIIKRVVHSYGDFLLGMPKTVTPSKVEQRITVQSDWWSSAGNVGGGLEDGLFVACGDAYGFFFLEQCEFLAGERSLSRERSADRRLLSLRRDGATQD